MNARQTKYAKLVGELRRKGVRDPRALAAHIGRNKLGKAEFQRRAKAGRLAAEYRRKRGMR